jgi:histidyl-tRNA synthetase
VYIALDRLDKTPADEVAAELARAGYDPVAVDRLLARLAVAETSGEGEVERALQETIAALTSLGVSARFDPTLVRGLGYYTGQVFEISHPDVSYSLAGGGRYDGMPARFGAPALAMCGFSIGFERICDMVDKDLFGPGEAKVAVRCATEAELLRCLVAARHRRESEPLLVINVVRRARNARKQEEDLRKLGYAEIVDGADFIQ